MQLAFAYLSINVYSKYGIAELADLINAIVYAAEGDYTLAVVSVAAIIPGVGIFATGAKAQPSTKTAIKASCQEL